MIVVGIIAAILLAAGLLPPYGELWKRRGRVIGINWVNMPEKGFVSCFLKISADCLPRSFSLWIGSAHSSRSWPLVTETHDHLHK